MIGWWVAGGLLAGFFLGCAYERWEQRSFGRKFLADARREAEQLVEAPGVECRACHPDYHENGTHAPGVVPPPPPLPAPHANPVVPRQRDGRWS